MKPSTEQGLRAFLYDATGHNKKQLKQIIKVATKMIDEADDYWCEIDAEYEMGRAPMPKGYWKRRDE